MDRVADFSRRSIWSFEESASCKFDPCQGCFLKGYMSKFQGIIDKMLSHKCDNKTICANDDKEKLELGWRCRCGETWRIHVRFIRSHFYNEKFSKGINNGT